MKGTILLAVMVCFGFVTNFFKSGSEKAREGKMKRKGLVVVMAAMFAVLGMGVGKVYATAPTLVAIDPIDPTEGPASIKYEVTITGNNFNNSTAVKFNGNTVLSIDIIDRTYGSPCKIVCKAPISNIGGDISVEVINTGYPSAVGAYKYILPPQITQISNGNTTVTEGPARGGRVVYIEGSNFNSDTIVEFDSEGVAATLIDSKLKCTTPSHKAGSVPVTVIDPYGQSDTTPYEYVTIPLTEKNALSALGLSGGDIECNWTGVTCNDDNTHVTGINLANRTPALTSVSNITSFTKLETLNLSGNQISNIDQLASISSLEALDVSKNQLTSLSDDFATHTNLQSNNSNFDYNALHITDTDLRTFLGNADQYWENKQTLPPTINMEDVVVKSVTVERTETTTENSIRLTWAKNPANTYGDGYKIEYSATGTEPFTEVKRVPIATTAETIGEIPGSSLTSCNTYRFRIRTYSDTNNAIESEPTVPITAKTLCIPYEEKQALSNLYNSLNADGTWFENPGTECNLTLTPYVVVLSDHEVVCNNDRIAEINLSSQDLNGKIDSDIGNFPNLRTLDLSENEITDAIPAEIGNLGSLEYLDLSGNNLTGGIPATLGSLSNLKKLYLQENSSLDNNLEGIPAELGNLSSLEYLYLYSSGISGSIPAELGGLTKLTELDLSDNSLSGNIPKELEGLGELLRLDLSNNGLNGSIPPWNGLGKLTHLFLNDNALEGSIPDEITNLLTLEVIKVNGNALSGNIPGGFASLPDLLSNESDFRWNALVPSDEGTFNDLIDVKQIGSKSWTEYQTLTPLYLRPSNVTQTKISLSWTPRGNTSDDGGYKIGFSAMSGGPYDDRIIEFDGITKGFYNDIAVESDTCHYIQVLARTDDHADNDNIVYSVPPLDNELEICTPPSDTPVIGEITPSNGPSSDGSNVTVTIIGAHFINTTEVYFDNEKASATYISETKLTCTPPKHAPDTVDVKVVNPGAIPLSATCGECYVYDPPPDVVSVTPNFGYDKGGSEVTITGSNFDGKNGVTVKFGGILAQDIDVISTTRIKCTTPAYLVPDGTDCDCDQVDVEVINADNLSDKLVDGYTYNKWVDNVVTITGISPNYGSAAGGKEVTITGSGFELVPSVTFNGIPATGVIGTSTEINCTTPSNPPETVDVVVENQAKYGGGKATCGNCYIYANSPQIKKVSPNNGFELTFTPITITGNYFDGSHVIFDKDEAKTDDEFTVALSSQTNELSPDGNVICPSDNEGQIQPCCLVMSPTEIKCLAPALSHDQYDVIVSNKDGQTDRCYGCYSFNSLPKPVITLVEPNQGPIFGDTFVHIKGANFVDDSKVTFAGKLAQSVTFISETELTCRTPAYYISDEPVNVKVSNPNSESDPCKCYTYKDCTFEVIPNQGAASGGTEVTIRILENETETEFTEETTVKFENVEVADVTFISPREIRCKTPANKEENVYKAGKVDVVVTKTYPGEQETTCLTAYTYTIIPEKERNALIELYEATDGGNWRRNMGWLDPQGSECTWYGIKCYDGDTHIAKIDLPDNKLKKELPVPFENDDGEIVSLGELEYLESLILRGNSLEGPLPTVLLDTNLIKHQLSDFSDNKCLYATDGDRPFFNRTQIEDDWEEDQHCKASATVFVADPSEPEVLENEEKEFNLKADTTESSNNEVPDGDVVIELFTLNPNQCEVLTESVVLSDKNWDTGVPVRVKGVNDGIKDGTKNCTIFLTTSAAGEEDDKYDGLSSNITVVVKDASELAIHSVSPTLGVIDKDMEEVRITGNGFDKNPHFFIFLQGQEDDKIEIPSEQIEIDSDTELVLTIPGQSEGTYILKATNGKEGEELKEDQQIIIFTDELSVEAQKRKRAIIVAGGKVYSGNALWNATLNSANKAYLTLISQGYTSDTIFYINPVLNIDVDEDGTEDVDGEATAAMLYYAINFWARGLELPELPCSSKFPPVSDEAASEVLIYITGHGRDSVFQIDGTEEEIQAKTLDRWLDNLQKNVNLEEILNSWSEEDVQSETGLKEDIDEWLENNMGSAVLQGIVPEMSEKLILIYDACMSGSFLSNMDVPGEKERYIVTSTDENSRAWFLYDGDFSFSSHFWNSVYLNGRLYKAFEYGKQVMSIDQEAQIYGVPNIPSLEEDILIGIGGVAASTYPEIEVCESFIRLTESSLESLKEKLSEDDSDTEPDILLQLEGLKNKAYLSEEEFIQALAGVITDEDQMNQYQSLILDSVEKVEVENTLSLCTNATLCATITNPGNGISFVLAQTISLPDESETASSETPVLVQPTLKLDDMDGTRHVYAKDHKDLSEIGKHEVSIYAVDKEGHYSVRKSIPIETTEAITGDINGNGDIELSDAIIALKLITGGEVPDTDICVFANVDGNSHIGLTDVIYILKQVSENSDNAPSGRK